jgi:spermidine/putrescine-binding protein
METITMKKRATDQPSTISARGGSGWRAILAAPYVARAQAKRVTFFSQGTYTDPKLIGHCQKETGIELVVQNFGDVEQLAAKLAATAAVASTCRAAPTI